MSTMTQLRIQQVGGILRGVRNPLPVFLDWLHLKRRPYVARTRDGVEMELRPGRGDWFSFYENLLHQEYLRDGQRLSPGDIVIDIGANIGSFAALAARRVGPTGKVIAAEPAGDTYRQLLANLRRNGFSNVAPHQLAVGGRSGTVEIRSSSNALYSSIYDSVSGHPVTGTVETVPLVTLEQLMRDAGVTRCSLLKVDCEGAEYEIFDSTTPQLAGRIDQIVMEVHQVPGRSPHTLVDRLKELGFEVRPGHPLYAWHKS